MQSNYRTEAAYRSDGSRCLRFLLTTLVSISLITGALYQRSEAQALSGQAEEYLRNQVEVIGKSIDTLIQGEFIYAPSLLPLFYQRRSFQLAWSGPLGPSSQAHSLINSIMEADLDGLNPEDYHLSPIEAILLKIESGRRGHADLNMLVDLDLLLTDAFLIYGSHLLAGRVDSEKADPEWNLRREKRDLAKILQEALEMNRIEETLAGFLPQHLGYMEMRRTLALYRAMEDEGGWSTVPDYARIRRRPPKRRLRRAARRPVVTLGGFVKALQQRLIITGDLDPQDAGEGYIFNDVLEQAVRRFQQRHGLDVDGIVGPATLGALNVSVEERIRQIELNMERCRWLNRDLGQRYLLVNIAGYQLQAIEDEKAVLNMRIIVGKQDRPTPTFHDQMTYLVFNPPWYVPPTIAKKDILPLARRNPSILAKKHLKVIRGAGKSERVINPRSINWAAVNFNNPNFRLRQDPGPRNPLGRVKFIFPNKYSVYIHDTVSRHLFMKSKRTFSSGCIRIENPIGLAEFALGAQGWDRQKINATIEKGDQKVVNLAAPIPVNIVYLTAWAEEDGKVQFRPDIYNRDKSIYAALKKSPSDSLFVNRKLYKNMGDSYSL